MKFTDTDENREKLVNMPLDKSYIIQAGPGSGKTTLLVKRIDYVISNWNKPNSGLACITYTNSAEDEILNKLVKKGINIPKTMFIGTIHSFLLENVIYPYGYMYDGKSYELLPMGGSRKYDKKIKELLNKNYISKIDRQIIEGIGYDENGNPFCFHNKMDKETAKKWKSYLWYNNQIDLQDIIYHAFAILKKYSYIANAISCRYPVIMVDEYQDVTYYQDKIFRLLEHTKFFFVGDPNQSIFSFSGAKPEIFLERCKCEDFANYELARNFRCSDNIIKFINKKSNFKQSEDMEKPGDIIVIDNTDKLKDAVDLFFRYCKEKKSIDDNATNYMIIGRRRADKDAINMIMQGAETESLFMNKLEEQNSRVYHILLNVVKAIKYHDLGIHNKKFEHIEIAMSRIVFNSNPHYKKLKDIKYESLMWKKLCYSVLDRLIDKEIRQVKIIDFLSKLHTIINNNSKEFFKVKLGNKTRILNYDFKNQKRMSKDKTMSDLISEIVLGKTESKELIVETIHFVKGLEANNVLIIAKDKFKLKQWLSNNNHSEESRVGFVAMSRAIKNLFIWYPNITNEDIDELFDSSEIKVQDTIDKEVSEAIG